jgi:hypothetical protein
MYRVERWAVWWAIAVHHSQASGPVADRQFSEVGDEQRRCVYE